MKQKHISFPSIEQFRNVVKTVRDRAKVDNVPLPVITFTGTVKLHGTNSAVCTYVNSGSEIWAQSRSNIITPQSDNAGFALFVETNKKYFNSFMDSVRNYLSLFDTTATVDTDIIAVYGEWCGSGIQKGVAISQLPKMFVVFGIAIVTDGQDRKYRWLDRETVISVYGYHCHNLTDSPIRCIYDYPTWSINIDFSRPEQVQNKLGELTEAVEQCCPVGNAHGVNGVGEGIVWKASFCTDPNFKIDDLIFKVKGEKHSVTKVKTLASVDIEKVNSISEYVNNVLTEARLQQGISFLIETGLPVDNVSTGPFLKWIGNDVLKEEADTLDESGLERKDVMPILNREARNWFLRQII